MTSIAAGDEAEFESAAENTGRRRAAGIYGAIITAAILDTVGGHASTTVLVISVAVTLLVYWIAKEYLGASRSRSWPVSRRCRPRSALLDRRRVGPGLSAQSGRLAGQRLVHLALGCSLEDPGDLGEQIGPPARSRSAATAAVSSPVVSSRHRA
jgi:hypothetical protein